MIKEFESCSLCPRNCRVNRNKGELGFCGGGNVAEISKIGLHFGEEPVISGTKGSGTIFFSHCNLGCIYCQNFEISRANSAGKKYTSEELSEKMLNLMESGAHNINLVTPTHYLPIIKKAVISAKEKGLNIPVVYNTSGFEHAHIIKGLKGVADIFLTDLKYYSPYYSKMYSNCEDYFDYSCEAVKAMVETVGSVKIGSDRMMKSGVIIRHLMLPSLKNDTAQVLRYISENFGDNVLVSLMRQYTPVCKNIPTELCKEVSNEEYQFAEDLFCELGLDGFVQSEASVGDDKIPKWEI